MKVTLSDSANNIIVALDIPEHTLTITSMLLRDGLLALKKLVSRDALPKINSLIVNLYAKKLDLDKTFSDACFNDCALLLTTLRDLCYNNQDTRVDLK